MRFVVMCISKWRGKKFCTRCCVAVQFSNARWYWSQNVFDGTKYRRKRQRNVKYNNAWRNLIRRIDHYFVVTSVGLNNCTEKTAVEHLSLFFTRQVHFEQRPICYSSLNLNEKNLYNKKNVSLWNCVDIV